jgi:hypothetical protein
MSQVFQAPGRTRVRKLGAIRTVGGSPDSARRPALAEADSPAVPGAPWTGLTRPLLVANSTSLATPAFVLARVCPVDGAEVAACVRSRQSERRVSPPEDGWSASGAVTPRIGMSLVLVGGSSSRLVVGRCSNAYAPAQQRRVGAPAQQRRVGSHFPCFVRAAAAELELGGLDLGGPVVRIRWGCRTGLAHIHRTEGSGGRSGVLT